MYVYFPLFMSCLCPKVMTPHGGAATLTCSCIAAGKADVRDHLWRKGPRMDDGNPSYKPAFPLREQLPVPNCVGQACRYIVHCWPRLQHA